MHISIKVDFMSANTLVVSKNIKEYRTRKPKATVPIISALKITMKCLKGSTRENTRQNTGI